MTMSPKRMCLSEKKKKKKEDENGAAENEKAMWEGLNPEILALIFTRVPAEQRIGVLSLVCKSWSQCLCGPYCWADIDIEQWCRKTNRTVFKIDSAVCKLVRRTKGTVRRLSAFKLGDRGFAFIANCGRFLKVLKIPMSEVTDNMVEKHAVSLANMAVLDISYCLKITCKGLEAFGKNCKALVHLRRNMPPPGLVPTYKVKPEVSEALTIADAMPGLQHLELGYGRFTDVGLGAIFAKCKALTHLDIQGCWGVKLDGHLEDRCLQLQEFKSPWHDDFDIGASSENDSDEADSDEESSSDMD